MIRREKKSRKRRGREKLGERRRGSGNRGGFGRAGIGKRGRQKKHKFLVQGITLGKESMKPKPKKIKVINLKELEEKLDNWVKEGKVIYKGGAYEVDLNKLGYDKLISSGKINKKVIVKVKAYTEKAKQKIESVGGKLIVE